MEKKCYKIHVTANCSKCTQIKHNQQQNALLTDFWYGIPKSITNSKQLARGGRDFSFRKITEC